MRPIEELQKALTQRFPGLGAEIDAPAEERGWWQLDIQLRDDTPWIVMEWKHDIGFGISTPDQSDYGAKPDELYPDVQAAYRRVVRLILSNGKTSSPLAKRLTKLEMVRNIAEANAVKRAEPTQIAVVQNNERGENVIRIAFRFFTKKLDRFLRRRDSSNSMSKTLIRLEQRQNRPDRQNDRYVVVKIRHAIASPQDMEVVKLSNGQIILIYSSKRPVRHFRRSNQIKQESVGEIVVRRPDV